MKRKTERTFFILLTIAALCLVLAGCGKDKKAETDPSSAPASSAAPQPVISSDVSEVLPELASAAPADTAEPVQNTRYGLIVKRKPAARADMA